MNSDDKILNKKVKHALVDSEENIREMIENILKLHIEFTWKNVDYMIDNWDLKDPDSWAIVMNANETYDNIPYEVVEFKHDFDECFNVLKNYKMHDGTKFFDIVKMKNYKYFAFDRDYTPEYVL